MTEMYAISIILFTVSCPAGRETLNSECVLCPIGEYKVREGTDFCTDCGQTASGEEKITLQQGAQAESDCIGKI